MVVIMQIKITINNTERAVVIPINYDSELDVLDIKELQIDPIPDKNEDISKDVVLGITQMILNTFRNIKN